jgi:signal transduction histidine kinase
MDRDAVPGGGAAGRSRPAEAANAGAQAHRRGGDPRASDSSLCLTLDDGRRITSVSSEAAAWFGASPEEMIGVDARTLLPFTSPVFAAIESCFATRKSAKVRFVSDFHPGRLVEAESHSIGAGVRVAWRVIGHRQSQGVKNPMERLGGRQSDKTSDDDLEFTLDRDWRITSITKSAAAWAGSTVADLLGRDGHQINPAATTLLAGPVEAALFRRASSTLEQPSTHLPGRWVRVEVDPVPGGARVHFEDITSQIGADDEETGDEPAEVVLLGPDGVIVSANAAWRAGIVALGLELADFGVGASYVDVAKAVVPTTDKALFSERLDALLSGLTSRLEATFSQATSDGEKRRQVQIAPIQVGEATYFLAIHEDLTERTKVLAALHETSDQLLSAQEKERQRIAIELHDSTSQHLAALTLGLAKLRKRIGQDDDGAQSLIDDVSELTRRALHETRVLSYLMNASGEDREGLEVAVHRFVRGFGRRAGLDATVETVGPVNAVGAAAQHAVFRVVQEALSNVHRHAQANKVSVRLVSQAGVLTARISDDGKGFRLAPVSEAPLGVGIIGMRTRIEQLGGTLEIDGAAGGTVVAATIPLRSAHSERSSPKIPGGGPRRARRKAQERVPAR